MFVNKVESGKGELEIVYDVQWKTPGNDDDKAKIIGIVDTPDALDTKLDWKTFKSYLIQNSGNMSFTTNDIRISYLDSDDDLIPVDSELEFRECLKFSRIRARKGRKIIMKVNMVSNGGAKPKEPTKYNEELSAKNVNPKLFCLKKKDMNSKILLKKPIENVEDKDPAPEWFEKYMAQFKAELVQEITSTVVTNVRAALSNSGATVSGNPGVTSSSQTNPAPSSSKGQHYNHPLHLIDKRKKKKKMLEEDSSDCTDGLQLQWEERLELLRHMQKINKREKKFEKKLDAKLEKLESKTKKLMEKKHSFSKKSGVFSPQTSATLPSSAAVPSVPVPSELVMDATPVDEYNYVPHVFCGELVHQVWKVMNDGQLPWTEETELRFAWGSKSLVPLTPVVKCPPLKPGETGKVKVTLQSPLIPGNFESYWHFHHQGRRFGQWLGCAVIVDPDPRPSAPPLQSDALKDLENAFGLCSVDQGPLPVDLTMKCQQSYPTEYNRTSTTDDMKIYNIETKPEVGKSEQESENLLQQASVKVEEPKMKESDNSIPNDSTSAASTSDSTRCVVETELEEFPRLESYTSQPETSFISDSFPDLVQRNDDNVMNKPDLNSWAKYAPHGSKAAIMIADILKMKNESIGGSEKNLHSGVKYENIRTSVENLSTKSEEKKNIDDTSAEVDLEYVSGSDSDNISIISGTVSLDSEDTEPSDDFVVVPMPTCINCDQPLEQHGCVPIDVPISVEIPHTSSDSNVSAHEVQLHTSDNNNNTQSSAVCLPVLQAEENSAIEATETPVKTEPEPNEEQKSSDDENTVYVRDKSGNSVPVAKVVRSRKNSTESPKPVEQPNIGFGVGVGIRHSIFGDPAFGQGPNGPRFPFSFGNDSPNSPPHCHNPGGPCNFRPQHESPPYSASAANMSFSVNDGRSQPKRSGNNDTFCSHFCPKDKQQSFIYSTPKRHFIHKIIQHQKYKPQQQPKPGQCLHRQPPQQPKPEQCLHRPPPPPPKFNPGDAMYQQQEMGASAPNVTRAPSYHNIHTEQPRACKYSYGYNNGMQEKSTANNTTPGSSSSRRSSSESRETSPVAAAVQILPETLVTGAVNVASSAINTARSVIDMLRPRHEEPVVAQWGQATPAMENSLRTLSEMGFNNRELNVMLLSQNGNDIARVICKLVQ